MIRRLFARVRRKVIAEGAAAWRSDEELIASAGETVPRRYETTAVHRYDDLDVETASSWMDRQHARAVRHPYRPFVALDCFHFAADCLRRAGAPIKTWQIYGRLADGATVVWRRRGRRRWWVDARRGSIDCATLAWAWVRGWCPSPRGADARPRTVREDRSRTAPRSHCGDPSGTILRGKAGDEAGEPLVRGLR